MSHVGSKLGPYQLEREIGRGNFGTVYLARHESTGETRAIKILLPWAAKDEQLRHRLRREAKLVGHLTNRYAVRIDECAEAPDGTVYIVMEYLEGEELTETLRREGKLALPRVERIAAQVLEALAEAHRLGVIHRDLKPHNIFLCRDAAGQEYVKVFDFGIAKVAGSGSLQETAKLTVSGGLLGTPNYMSPEQCRGDDLTTASDLYALGIVLYELLTGGPPFDDENPALVLLAHCSNPVPPLPPSVRDTPLGRAIVQALEKDASQRFSSAEAFLAAIGGQMPPASAAAPVPAKSAASTPARSAGASSPASSSPASSSPANAPSASTEGPAPAKAKTGCAVLLFVPLAASAGAAWWLL